MAAAKDDKAKASAGPVWARRLAGEAGAANLAYCAGWDVRERMAADLELLPWDLWTNRAHCLMLGRAKVIPPGRLKKILRALDALEREAGAGRWRLDPALEDVHVNVEAWVESQAGPEAAGMMHTARSRNDQVACDIRLWLRARLLEFIEADLGLVATLRRLARRGSRVLMPGLTHHQPGAWTTLGHWAASHAYAFARDAQALLELEKTVNLCPLGAAASFGTSWPIDRHYAAALMGFDAPQTNSLDCVTNRSECEARAAGALAVWAQHAATLSQDLILFSSPPWQLLRLGDAFVTGSSIMPQKRNPDFAEVTKAKAALAGATAATLLDLTRGDPSGYNREQQWSKYLMQELFAELGPAPTVLSGALDSLDFDRRRMRELLRDDYLEAADVADYLAQTRDVPFRRCYRWLGEAVRRSEEEGVPLAEAVNVVLAAEKGVRGLSPEEREQLESAEWLVGRRGSHGGPSPESVLEQVEELRALERTLGRALRAWRGKVASGRRRLEAARRQAG